MPERPATTRLRAGDADGALRAATPALEAQPADLDSFLVVVEGLLGAGRPAGVGSAAAVLARALGSDGRWPLALVAADVAARAGHDRGEVLADLARLLGAGSDLLVDAVGVSPPPEVPEVPPLAADVRGGALYARALQAATVAASALAAVRPGSALPRAPILSRLDGDAFAAFAAAFVPRRVPAGEVLIEQGANGNEVFFVAEGTLRVARSKQDEPGDVELARLGPGALVGEMALVSRQPRSASVTAYGPATVLQADREALDAAARNPTVAAELVAHCRRRMAETLLVASPMLSSVPSNERPAVLAALAPRALAAGEVLIAQGADADGLTLIVQGEVEVVREDAGERTVIATLGPGNVVGEISVVLRRPATASVVAVTDGVALHLHRDSFMALAKAHPTLLARLYTLAVERETETMSIVAADAVSADDLLV